VLEDIRELMDFEPAHFSLYALKVEPGTPLAVRVGNEPALAPDDDRFADEMGAAEDLLTGAGFARYEVSNFARKGKWSRHNVAYWRGGDYLGLGLNATSCIRGVRTRNHRAFAGYRAALARGELPVAEREELSSATVAFERSMLGLRTMWGITPEGFSSKIWQGLHAKAVALDKVEPGLVRLEDARIALTSRGMNVGNAVTLALVDGLM
jgi:oxygen-independent coproporphyrinogen-3 oxidase